MIVENKLPVNIYMLFIIEIWLDKNVIRYEKERKRTTNGRRFWLLFINGRLAVTSMKIYDDSLPGGKTEWPTRLINRVS